MNSKQFLPPFVFLAKCLVEVQRLSSMNKKVIASALRDFYVEKEHGKPKEGKAYEEVVGRLIKLYEKTNGMEITELVDLNFVDYLNPPTSKNNCDLIAHYISHKSNKYKETSYFEEFLKEYGRQYHPDSFKKNVIKKGYEPNVERTQNLHEQDLEKNNSNSAKIDTTIQANPYSKSTYPQFLSGAWHVYYFDSNEDGVYRTMLWIEHIGNDYRISLKTPWGSNNIKTGVGKIYGRAIRIEMDGELPHLTLMAKLPSNEVKKEERAMLNTTGVIFGEADPIQINPILVKDWSATNEQVFLNNGINQVKYEPLPKNYSIKERSVEEDRNEIIIYLTRHQDRIIKSFFPYKGLTISVRNERYHEKMDRHEYLKLKSTFNENEETNKAWYSLSRIVDDKDNNDKKEKIACFRWKFSFDPTRQKVNVERDRKGHSCYTGEATLNGIHLNVALKFENKKFNKNFMADVPKNGIPPIIEGISSTINYNVQKDESLNLAVREILFYCKKSMIDNIISNDGLMSYEHFLDFEGLPVESKLYLANRDASILSYPNPADKTKQHYRRSQASRFEGLYYLILHKNFNKISLKKELYYISLTIDKLANVSLTIYTKQTGSVKYWGYVHYYEKNLHLQLESEAIVPNIFKINYLIFDASNLPSTENPEFFSGLSMNTNENYSRLSPFIIAKKSAFPVHPFNSGTLKSPPKKLEELINKHVGKTTEEYFFGT